ncbi:MAG: Brp/Blh family beta-carotene 15,15'-dioxygenase [Fulvivirga sp.]|uniref:Brp/Blh family beta-carotene 15,15'-dioxygenase n=1 Tax=Fulvivirga sp. TaxID=1931237 RepID=UPI0032ED4E6A
MAKLDKHLLIITLALVALLSLIRLPSGLDTILFLVTIIVIGIPHGALDHVIEFKNANPSRIQLVKFYAIYISLIVVVCASWYLFPQLSFLVFIAISAYHFGQSQLYYFPVKGILSQLYFLSWGMALLAMIIFTNIDECLIIFKSLEWLNTTQLNSSFWLILLASSSVLWFTMSLVYFLTGVVKFKDIGKEVLLLAMFCAISLTSNAVITFTIYFGIWHSFRSLILTFKSIKEDVGNSIVQFIKAALPFSIAGIVFLGLGYYFSFQFDLGISIYMIFIIIISTLTVPHLFVMNRLYNPIH